MKNKKCTLIIVIIVLILIVAKSMFSMCFAKSRKPPESLDVFIEFLENGNIEELNLRIYYSFLLYHGREPVTNPRTLRRSRAANEIVIDGNILSQYIDLLREVGNTNLIPVPARVDYEIDVRTYYVFETRRDGILLEVGMWAFYTPFGTRYLVVNGVVVENDSVFHEIILPFFPYVPF